jgi:hypothetical protein
VQHILLEPTEITTLSGRTVPLFMSVQYISFSAHTDFLQTSGFIDILKPPHVILVHGDKNEMHRLKTSLQSRYEGQNIKILSPKNCQTVVLPFQGERTAKIMGEIVKDVSSPEQLHGYQVHGLMVTKDFHHHIVDPTDLHTYTHMHIASLFQKQRVPFTLSTTVLVRALHQMFDNVLQVTYKGKSRAHCINDIIFVVPKLVATSKKIKADPAAMEVDEQELDPDAPLDHVTLVWTSNEVADLLADGIVGTLVAPAELAQHAESQQDKRRDHWPRGLSAPLVLPRAALSPWCAVRTVARRGRSAWHSTHRARTPRCTGPICASRPRTKHCGHTLARCSVTLQPYCFHYATRTNRSRAAAAC